MGPSGANAILKYGTADLAGHLAGHVLGGLPVRQCVLTLPHRLRYALALHHELCRAVLGVFIRALCSAPS